MIKKTSMAGLDPATQQASVSERRDSFACAGAHALGGRVALRFATLPGHGEDLL